MNTLRDSAEAALRLLEQLVEKNEEWWGLGRSLEELEMEGDLPAEILHLRLAIEQYDETIQSLIQELIGYQGSIGKDESQQ